MVPLCAAFSPDGRQLAVGLENGGLKGFEFHPDMRQVGCSFVVIYHLNCMQRV
jgi:hypothetical protein